MIKLQDVKNYKFVYVISFYDGYIKNYKYTVSKVNTTYSGFLILYGTLYFSTFEEAKKEENKLNKVNNEENAYICRI